MEGSNAFPDAFDPSEHVVAARRFSSDHATDQRTSHQAHAKPAGFAVDVAFTAMVSRTDFKHCGPGNLARAVASERFEQLRRQAGAQDGLVGGHRSRKCDARFGIAAIKQGSAAPPTQGCR
jgi:hypothetical protein